MNSHQANHTTSESIKITITIPSSCLRIIGPISFPLPKSHFKFVSKKIWNKATTKKIMLESIQLGGFSTLGRGPTAVL